MTKRFISIAFFFLSILCTVSYAEDIDNLVLNAEPGMGMSLRELDEQNGRGYYHTEEYKSINEGLVPYYLETDYNSVNGIIDDDNRLSVDSTQYPFSAIANLKVHQECGCNGSASGFMVSDNMLVTAAHVLVCTEHNKKADRIVMYFGCPSSDISIDNSLYIYDGHFTYWYGTDFPDGYTKESQKWDYGYVKLDQPIGNNTGWFELKIWRDDDIEDNYIRIAGYQDNKLKTGFGSSELSWSYSDYIFNVDADMVPGNSGGPAYILGDNNKFYAVGINISGNSFHNSVRRFTTDLVDKIKHAK